LACQFNERTYQLAACGVPQLVDHPKLLDKIFSPNALCVADTPTVYARIFHALMERPELAYDRALQAQKEVFLRHAIFHRAEDFVHRLAEI
jgi:spore maturation protein CgeB